MKGERRYTVAEANELLPYLAPALVELQEKLPRARELRAEISAASLSNGGPKREPGDAALMARVDELMERLAGWEVELRDPATGLVDFPATIGGRDAYLCWRLGEPEVAHWHSPDDGFQGRRPL